MKKAVYPIVWLLHWVGSWFRRWCDYQGHKWISWLMCKLFFHPYKTLMIWSLKLNDWAGLHFYQQNDSWMDDDEFLRQEEMRPLEEAQAAQAAKFEAETKDD